jgi:transposase-like protein
MAKEKSEETKKAAVDMLRKGETIARIAKTYGVSRGTIKNWTLKYGGKTAAVSVAGQTTVTLPEETKSAEIHIKMPHDLNRVYDALTTLKQAGLLH